MTQRLNFFFLGAENPPPYPRSRIHIPPPPWLVDFKYIGYLENSLNCVTLHAHTCAEPAKDIVVKFVDQYGDGAHHLLMDKGLVPKLWYCRPPVAPDAHKGQPLYHSLFVVMMEYIEGQTFATVKANMDPNAMC